MSDLAMIFARSAGLGVAVAAPVGPMSLLCMRRSLTQGWRHGLATGAGIATADGLYALVAALGLAGVSAFLLAHERALHGLAGLVLIWLGARTILARADADAVPRDARRPAACFAGAVLLTLSNPPTIITFAAFFTALAPDSGFDLAVAEATVAGVFCGSLLWWLGLVAVLSAMRHAIPGRLRAWIGRAAGAVLCLFGLAQLGRALEPPAT